MSSPSRAEAGSTCSMLATTLIQTFITKANMVDLIFVLLE